MELELVTFKQAKALKELGFPQNIYTSKVYLEKTIPHDIIAKECGLGDWQCIGGKLIPCSSDYDKYGVDTCCCPTLELVAKWLREEKNIHIQIGNFDGRLAGYSEVSYMYVMSYIKPIKSLHNCYTLYDSYEAALSAGIDKAIKILNI